MEKLAFCIGFRGLLTPIGDQIAQTTSHAATPSFRMARMRGLVDEAVPTKRFRSKTTLDIKTS
jgi:hypothetical protein